MKDIIKCGIIICCVVLISTVPFFIFNNPKHEPHEEIIAIIDTIKSTQEPIKEVRETDYIYKYYEDICLVFKSSGAYVRAEIIGDKYKLNAGIKVGSEKNVVEQTYAKKYKIKNLPDNQFGFIEGIDWFCFCYDESDKVEKILIYSVGP